MFGLDLFRTGSHCVSPSTLEFTILLPLVSQVHSVYSRVTTTPDQEFGFIDKKKKGKKKQLKANGLFRVTYFIGLFLPAQVGWSPLTAVHLSFCWDSPVRIPFDHVTPSILCPALICWAIKQKLNLIYLHHTLSP